MFTGRLEISVSNYAMLSVRLRRGFTLNTMGSQSGKLFQIHSLACSETGSFTAKVSPVEIEMYN